MKFCLGSQCRTQDGLSPRRRMAAIVPLIATLPSTIMLPTRHHHDPKDTSSTGLGLLAGLAVGVLVGVGIIVIKKNMSRRW